MIDVNARQRGRLRTGGDDDVLGRQVLHRAVGAGDRHLARAGDLAEADEVGDLVLLHQEFDTLGQGVHAVLLGLHHLDEVELGRRHFDADIGEFVGRCLEEFRRVQQGLRGHAADVEAGATQDTARFDDRRLQAELAGADGCIIAARTATDDHYVE